MDKTAADWQRDIDRIKAEIAFVLEMDNRAKIESATANKVAAMLCRKEKSKRVIRKSRPTFFSFLPTGKTFKLSAKDKGLTSSRNLRFRKVSPAWAISTDNGDYRPMFEMQEVLPCV